MKTIVTFIRPWNRYNRGETAGFDPATAAGLIGIHAVPYRPAEVAPAAPAPAPAAPEPPAPAASFETAMAALETPAETAPKAAATGADLPVQGRRK
ncbi:hypothetical protein U5903_14810 [Cereibacter johrii]|uniref:hypothetical protein n=1 Tax=Cereibacter johrii TaxID=445629 RepID=UPI002B26109F|nr:hypothetical protein [Cereibacter johrii]MEA5162047.1 hypothetical protein [Cereibacter johrii]